MNKDATFLSVKSSKFFGIDEQAFMVLFLAIALVQIACAFSATSNVVASAAPMAKIAPIHSSTMLAKR